MKTKQLPKPARKILTQIYNEMKDITVLLIQAHGINTPGKRWTFEDGTKFEEWEFSREVIDLIAEKLIQKGIKYVILPDSNMDIGNNRLVEMINKYDAKKTFGIAVHSNNNEGNGHTGSVENFIAVEASNLSYMFAEIIRVEFRNEFPDYVYRGTKRKDFTVLSESNCPMVLSENFYYDDYKEVTEILNTKQGRKRIANFHVKAIERVVNELY